ncbi:hypothetical protein [Oryzicola mucosus]|uniref:DUF1344 domain-containing protein n=1 Tax=Oryzicola mucosus TaxID=2767425 RepID=A0A8J6PHC2_9HYPH|nr:hypothetical protein [Oryzicola mucosus]MBD0413451.1 hypothetical protein [Oryzicola mucosus]
MKKILISAAALALLGGSAFAAVPVSGTVEYYNPETRVITFESGQSVTVPLDVAIPANLQAGSHASVDFNGRGDKVDVVFTR